MSGLSLQTTASPRIMALAERAASSAVISGNSPGEPSIALAMRVPSWLVIAGVSMAVSVSQSGCATASSRIMLVALQVLMVASESGVVSGVLSRPLTKAASWVIASSVEPVRGAGALCLAVLDVLTQNTFLEGDLLGSDLVC